MSNIRKEKITYRSYSNDSNSEDEESEKSSYYNSDNESSNDDDRKTSSRRNTSTGSDSSIEKNRLFESLIKGTEQLELVSRGNDCKTITKPKNKSRKSLKIKDISKVDGLVQYGHSLVQRRDSASSNDTQSKLMNSSLSTNDSLYSSVNSPSSISSYCSTITQDEHIDNYYPYSPVQTVPVDLFANNLELNQEPDVNKIEEMLENFCYGNEHEEENKIQENKKKLCFFEVCSMKSEDFNETICFKNENDYL
jgi:hypothetical protein